MRNQSNPATLTTTWAALLAMAFTLTPVSSAQDAFGYTANSAVPYAYADIAGTGTTVLATTDDGTATLSLPFAFRFYGTNYSSVCVSTNGLMSFSGCPANDFTNLDLTAQSPTGNQPLVAPFWMDLSFAVQGAGSVVYQTLGAAPNRQFIVQWNNATALNVPGALNFQVVLAETANTILFQYQNVQTGSTAVSLGASATVGIRDAGGNQNGRRLQWSYQAPVLANSLAIRFTPPSTGATIVDVSAAIRATTSAFIYNRVNQTYSGTVTVANVGTTTLAIPLQVVLTALTAGVTALDPTGTAPGLGPYYTAPGVTPLGPGQSVTVTVRFSNPSGARIGFVVKAYSGNF